VQLAYSSYIILNQPRRQSDSHTESFQENTLKEDNVLIPNITDQFLLTLIRVKRQNKNY